MIEAVPLRLEYHLYWGANASDGHLNTEGTCSGLNLQARQNGEREFFVLAIIG